EAENRTATSGRPGGPWRQRTPEMGTATDLEPPSSAAPPCLASTVRRLSDRLVAAQRGVRLLDAVGWGDDVERDFFAKGGRRLPDVTRDTYRRRPLPFSPDDRLTELAALDRDVRRQLGTVAGPY